jgi:hypothetical protein
MLKRTINLHRLRLHRHFSKLAKTDNTEITTPEQVNETKNYLKDDLTSRKAEFDKMMATIDSKPDLMAELKQEGND